MNTLTRPTYSHPSPREIFEDRENDFLSPLAAMSREAQRPVREDESTLRTSFQRDRDRVIHSKSFRRLKHKTQVFISPGGDHYRTRLTHTLEVSQIARTIGRALALNEDLIEAISLAHDLGHTPFGHAGETALAEYLPGFRHNEQSLRVVDLLEKDGRGLNLTNAVRDGIISHSKPDDEMTDALSSRATTLEGEVVRLSDAVAYINHDLDDAIRSGMLEPADLPGDVLTLLGSSHASRIDHLVTDIVGASNTFEPPGSIRMSAPTQEAANALRTFLFDAVYRPLNRTENMNKARSVVAMLCSTYEDRFELLPEEFRRRQETDGTSRVVADFVASMTDRFAIEQFEVLYVPQYWSIDG